MGLEELYTKAIHEEFGVGAAFPPNQPIQLGDFGTFEEGRFVRAGTLPFAPGFQPRVSAVVHPYYQVGKVSRVALAAGSSVEPGGVKLANVGLDIQFGSSFGALLVLRNARLEEMPETESLGREILRRASLDRAHPEWWDPRYGVVTELVRVDSATLFCSRARNKHIVLEATGGVPRLELADAEASFDVRLDSTAEGHFLPAKGSPGSSMTPLFRVRGVKRAIWGLGRPRFDTLSMSAPEASGATPSELLADGVPLGEALARSSSVEVGLPANVDELYVVSDLHIGGAPGMRAFGDDDALGWLGRELARRAQQSKLAWVIAGDVLDFLAYETKAYFDPRAALNRLSEIASTHPRTFEGLRAFNASAKGELVVLLGNHDIELAHPDVWSAFCRLAGLPAGARPRMEEGFRAIVGGETIVVKHGNEADEWNNVDYPTLRAKIDRGDWPGWRPNLGTALVVDQMNAAKRRYPFVDLLKPEEGTVELVLIALGYAPLRSALSAIGKSTAIAIAKAFSGRLEDDPSAVLPSYTYPRASSATVLETVSRELAIPGRRPIDLVEMDQETLGRMDYVFGRLAAKTPLQALQSALADVRADTSFDPSAPDKWSRWFGEHFPPDASVLVVGHTHLAKLLDGPTGAAGATVYANTGTWMPLIDLPKLLDQPAQFERFWASAARSIAELEAEGFVQRPRNVVRVTATEVSLLSVVVGTRSAGDDDGGYEMVVRSSKALPAGERGGMP